MDTTQHLTKDARQFIDGVTRIIRQDHVAAFVSPKMEALFDKVASHARGETHAQVESVVSLTEAERVTIAQKLKAIFQKDIELECVVSPDMIGGIIIKVGDWIFDSSLRSQLQSLARSLAI